MRECNAGLRTVTVDQVSMRVVEMLAETDPDSSEVVRVLDGKGIRGGTRSSVYKMSIVGHD